MKYGIIFSVASVLFAVLAKSRGDLYFFFLWPALSFAIVASGYFCFGPRVYGKSQRGILSPVKVFLLLPYLLYSWSVWYGVRLVKRESAYDQLSENVFIGRRLMSHELPEHIDHVVDLTCEFTEPKRLRSRSYHSFQILDGFVPTCDQLCKWVETTARLSGNVYIHCAEGHGRTGLFAAALLLHRDDFQTVDDALQFIKSRRPLVRIGRQQLAVLNLVQTTFRSNS